MAILQLRNTKHLPILVTEILVKYLIGISETNPPLQIVDVSGISQEIEHGQKVLDSLLQNQMIFTHLKTLKMSNCAEWWQRHREECKFKFEALINLLNACESLEEIDLSENEMDGEQIRDVVHAIRQSLSKRVLTTLHLDKNRPNRAIADEVLMLVKEAPALVILHLLGVHGFTHLRVDYSSMKSKAVIKKIFKRQDTFIRVINTISKEVYAEMKTKKKLDLVRH